MVCAAHEVEDIMRQVVLEPGLVCRWVLSGIAGALYGLHLCHTLGVLALSLPAGLSRSVFTTPVINGDAGAVLNVVGIRRSRKEMCAIPFPLHNLLSCLEVKGSYITEISPVESQ
eukprot:1748740-Amphidinium_carterae.1